MTLKLQWAIFVVLLLVPISLPAQADAGAKLSLKGSAATCLPGEIKDPQLYCYKLRMTYENRGIKPVIILNPNLGYGTGLKEAKFYFSWSEFDNEKNERVEKTAIKTVTLDSDPAKKENFEAMSRFFDGDQPPENMTIILQPGESFTFDENIEIKTPYVTPAPRISRSTKPDGTTVIYTHPESRVAAGPFILSYEFSFLSLVPDPDFLEKLQIKWRQYGYLPVGVNGTFAITSAPLKEVYRYRILEEGYQEERERQKREWGVRPLN